MNKKEIELLLEDIIKNDNHDLSILIDLNIKDFKNLLLCASKKNIKLCYYYDILRVFI